MLHLFSSAWWCTWVYPTTKHPGVDLKFVFCTMGKLDVNKRHTQRRRCFEGRLGECVGVTKEENMVETQD